MQNPLLQRCVITRLNVTRTLAAMAILSLLYNLCHFATMGVLHLSKNKSLKLLYHNFIISHNHPPPLLIYLAFL